MSWGSSVSDIIHVKLFFLLQDYDAVWEFWVPGVLLTGKH